MNKYKMTLVSMMVMWPILFLKTVDIPIYFGPDYKWVSFTELITIPNCVALGSLILFGVSLWFITQLNYNKKGSPSSLTVKILKAEDINYEYVNSFASLVTLFSVLIIDYDCVRNVLILLVLLSLIFLIYSKTNLYYCNAVFAIIGYRIVRVTTNTQELPNGSIVLSRKCVEDGNSISAFHIDDNVFISL